MKNFALLCVLILTLHAGGLFSGSAASDLHQLMPRTLERPYLHFTKNELPAMRERVRRNPRAEMVYQRLLRECDRLMEMPVPRQAPSRSGTDPYYEGSGYGPHLRLLSMSAYKLAFIFQITGDDKYAKKSYEFLDSLCSLDSWENDWGKFQWLYWMGKPFGAKWNEDDDNEILFSYSLTSADVSRLLAATYDWLYPVLDRYQRKRIRSALLENALLQIKGHYDYHWWAHAWRTNWLPVCFSGVGMAALALYPEDPQLLEVVEESRTRMNRYLEESIGLEGGYQEGLHYWRRGIENVVLFAQTLKNISSGKINMFDNPRLKSSILFPLYTFTPPRGSIAFGDGYETLEGNWELYNKLAEEFKSPEAKWLAQFFYALDNGQTEELDLFSIIWPEADIIPSLPDSSAPMSFHFRNIDWIIMRGSWEDVNYPLLAAKGGIHDDPHHGHLDAGQFAIKYRGEWYVRELGYMDPSGLGYWDYRRRFAKYVHANSLGHNVIFVNGEMQEYGQNYFAKVTKFQTSDSQDYAVIDASKAYPGKELKAWRRHVIFQKPHLFVVLDEIDSAENADIAVRIHPGVSFELKNRFAVLTGQSGMLSMLPLLPRHFTLKEGRHAVLPETRNARLTWIPYYDLITKATGNRTYVVSMFAPTENESEAEHILKASSVRVDKSTMHLEIIYRGTQISLIFDISDSARLQ